MERRYVSYAATPNKKKSSKNKKNRRERSQSSGDDIHVLREKVNRILRNEPISKSISGKQKKSSKFNPKDGMPQVPSKVMERRIKEL